MRPEAADHAVQWVFYYIILSSVITISMTAAGQPKWSHQSTDSFFGPREGQRDGPSLCLSSNKTRWSSLPIIINITIDSRRRQQEATGRDEELKEVFRVLLFRSNSHRN